ncbi:DUF6684 family protein [Haladaptatus sp. DFWS20]|uniref:DUF6684 family protein n=1 Tax=Haladaptatus sp. DFWS20 TaxID=3403467 RepID=UPI003EBB3B34
MAEADSNPVFDRETLLDITVNIVPMFILAFFLFLFLFFSPWPDDTFMGIIGLGLTIIPLVLLGLLTWIAAHYVR